ncbi:hypothetical protein [Idiomarina baltica]|uniref:hypothetical protein n=1 Tax=Idiomarina baltica TaxID=190892 RepID=UPI0023529467|nr:hypothetical protein [Idiomarina baltica]
MAIGLCNGRWTPKWLSLFSFCLPLSMPLTAQQVVSKTTDPLALSEQLKTELKAYQAWQVAMEQKKRDLAFAELQLNWLKKQVEIAQQQKLLRPTSVAAPRPPKNCIRIAQSEWRLRDADGEWFWAKQGSCF